MVVCRSTKTRDDYWKLPGVKGGKETKAGDVLEKVGVDIMRYASCWMSVADEIYEAGRVGRVCVSGGCRAVLKAGGGYGHGARDLYWKLKRVAMALWLGEWL